MSTYLLVDHPTTSGNAARVDPERDGLTRSGRTTESPRQTCGGERRAVATEEQGCGPRWPSVAVVTLAASPRVHQLQSRHFDVQGSSDVGAAIPEFTAE